MAWNYPVPLYTRPRVRVGTGYEPFRVLTVPHARYNIISEGHMYKLVFQTEIEEEGKVKEIKLEFWNSSELISTKLMGKHELHIAC